MINCLRVYTCVENFDKIGTIKCIRLRIIRYKVILVALSNLIQEYMAISINIIQDLRKVLLSKNRGCHESDFEKYVEVKDYGIQTSPKICEGKYQVWTALGNPSCS